MPVLAADERTALVDSVRRLFADKSTEAQVRQVMETPQGYDPALWKQLAEMGVVGLAIPEAHGGSGASAVELELVMEEAGAALVCSPLQACVLAAALVQASGDAEAAQRILPRIADGSLIATAALTGEAGTWTSEGVTVTAAGDVLTGTASFVVHGQNAGLFIVAAKTGDGVGLYEVEAGANGLTVDALPTFDHTLRLAKLTFANTPARRLGSAGWSAVEDALAVGLVALAGEQAGGARRAFEITVEYAKSRIQFGRPIGSFQAIKHMAADLLLESESATSAARAAAAALAEDAPDKDAAVALAAFACADAFSKVTFDAIQMHGGIAFTWAHPAHLYLRRARADAQLLGAPAYHRERYLQALGA